MFFLKKSNWAGQAFPILLICIAGLVVAVFATKIIGDSKIAETSASNAADAGSLAAASVQAGAFNRLVYRNWNKTSEELALTFGHQGKYMGYSGGDYFYYKELNYFYNWMRNKYKLLYDDAVDDLDEAYRDAETAAMYIYDSIELAVPKGECEIWSDLNTVSMYLTTAQINMEVAAKYTGAFHVDTFYMNQIAAWFKTYQLEQLCKAFTFMEESYTGSIKSGQYYALINSGYTSSLSSPDAFNFWIAGGVDGSAFNPSGGNSVSWPPDGSGCTIDAKVEVPKIITYEIKMSAWDYPPKHSPTSVPCCYPSIPSIPHIGDLWNVGSARTLSNDMRLVAKTLGELALEAKSIYELTKWADENCWECVGCPPLQICTVPCAPPAYAEATTRTNLLKARLICIRDWLAEVIYTSSVSRGTIPQFQEWNDLIWNNLWPAPGAETKFIINSGTEGQACDEAWAYAIPNDEAKGVFMVNIDVVTQDNNPDVWKVKCDVAASCGATKKSKSKFFGDGGGYGELVGQFDDKYYPEVTDI